MEIKCYICRGDTTQVSEDSSRTVTLPDPLDKKPDVPQKFIQVPYRVYRCNNGCHDFDLLSHMSVGHICRGCIVTTPIGPIERRAFYDLAAKHGLKP